MALPTTTGHRADISLVAQKVCRGCAKDICRRVGKAGFVAVLYIIYNYGVWRGLRGRGSTTAKRIRMRCRRARWHNVTGICFAEGVIGDINGVTTIAGASTSLYFWCQSLKTRPRRASCTSAASATNLR